jgi:hypothetical protein
MGLIKRNFFISFIVLLFFLSLVTDWYYELSILLFAATVITTLDKLGKGIVLRELIVVHAVFVCLISPIAGYEVYNQHNHLSRIFVKYMMVPKDRYFGFVLPAVLAFSLAICWPITKKKYALDEGVAFRYILGEIKKRLAFNSLAGAILIVIGIVMFYITDSLPIELRFVASLCYSACFSGVLYIYYSPSSRSKKLLLLLFALFIMWTTVQSGVFTIVAYMGITLFSFFFIGRRQKLWKKFLACLVGVLFLFLIQDIKSGFRKVVWKNDYTGNRTKVFSDIAYDKLSNIDKLNDVDALYPIYTRTNQGFNVALVMRRIPAAQDFDGGSRLALITASSLIPRFLWPDKPEAGGQESMLYFTGIHIVGWSTNVGPIGEAYGSFGIPGGIFFMFLLGVFIRGVYKMVFVIALRFPLLVLWIPVLFFQVTYSMETDTLQILNSLFKGAFFIWLLYKVLPSWFGVVKKSNRSVPIINPNRNIPA